MNSHVVKAIFKRDFSAYFSSPTGYVFITIFIFMSAIAAFWNERFFLDNLANLDQLNRLMPYLLMIFIPAITMNSWAGEKNQGTDELLLTLPVRDEEVVLGKYLAGLGIYTVSLLFAMSHIAVLCFLGTPDMGVMFGTYFGYWLMGAMLLSIGMVASALTTNSTIAFIYAGVLCAILVMAGDISVVSYGLTVGSGAESETAGAVLQTPVIQRFFEWISVPNQFGPLGRGRFLFSNLVYFGGLTAVFLFINVVLVSRRHWIVRGEGRMAGHMSLRSVAVFVTAISIPAILQAFGLGFDVTSEGLHTLSSQTRVVLQSLPSDRAVFVEAFISPKVPQAYVETRQNLISMLEEFDRIGGSNIRLVIHETEKYTEVARAAQDNYGIRPLPVPPGIDGIDAIYLAVAFHCGAEEDVVNFDRGLNVEYELTRSLRVVARATRKTIGIVETEAKVSGGFDRATFQRIPSWSFVNELRRQYKIKTINADQAIPDDVDALIVALPSSLTQKQIDNVKQYSLGGGPTLLICDPMPMFNPGIAPSRPRAGGGNRFQPQQQPKQDPKGSLNPFFDALGVAWSNDRIVWQIYNPHPNFGNLSPDLVFVSPGADDSVEAFNQSNPITSGLQEMVTIYAGTLEPIDGSKTTFIPLLKTGRTSGRFSFRDYVQTNFFGGLSMKDPGERLPDEKSYCISAEITGPAIAKDAAGKEIHTIVITDLDMFGESFFQFRRKGIKNLNFDNITFLLNCVDQLIGEKAFIELRKKRVKHRTLTTLEEQIKVFEQKLIDAEQEAEKRAKDRLKTAEKVLNDKVAEIQNSNLSAQAKAQKLEMARSIEQRRFEIAKSKIEEEKEASVERARAQKVINSRSIRSHIRLAAIFIPPLPALLIALIILANRRSRENVGASSKRMV